MHRIRLREPWTAELDADSRTVVYARKFHKPTGAVDEKLTLQITLQPPGLEGPELRVLVLVNGRQLLPNYQSENCQNLQTLRFQLEDLATFNSLELRIVGANGKTGLSGPQFEPIAIPKFGSFAIESVELQIE